MNQSVITALPAQRITPAAFHPYGQVIFATADGKAYDATDAQLSLDRGTPRFYIMRLHRRGRHFSTITRHQQCTQCLGALEGKTWLIGVAAPTISDCPALAQIVAFEIPGNCFIKLHPGTWHAGPYFDAETVDFYNLELADTNITDHETCDLRERYQREFEITTPD